MKCYGLPAVTFHPPVLLISQHREWLRGPAHMVGEQVFLDRDKATRYQPSAEPKMLFDLAAIRRPADAIAFVAEYGLLRHGPAAPYAQEPFQAWAETAYTFTNLLDLYHLIRAADDGDQAAMATLWDEWSHRIQPLLRAAPETNQELLAAASHTLGALVSEGLRDAEIAVDSVWETTGGEGGRSPDPGAFAFAPRFRDLIGLAYFSLAMMVCLRTPLRVCAYCGRKFAPRSRTQRFHDRQCALKGRRRGANGRIRDHSLWPALASPVAQIGVPGPNRRAPSKSPDATEPSSAGEAKARRTY